MSNTPPDPENPAPPRQRRLRGSLEDAAWPVREAAWKVEERVLWPARDAVAERVGRPARSLSERAKYPFERAYWAFEERILWRASDAFAARVGRPGRLALAGGLAAAALGAGAVGVLSGAPAGDPEPVAATAPVATTSALAPVAAPAPPAEPAAPAEPVLQGVAPSFKIAASRDEERPAAPVAGEPATDGAARGKGDSKAPEPLARPAEVDRKTPPLTVARTFAEAFVLYEVGESGAETRAVFAKTAAPELARSLRQRPPRLPEKVRVPKARVLNIVAGPRKGKRFSVSAALLRLGATSELRLELEHSKDGWVVGDVRG